MAFNMRLTDSKLRAISVTMKTSTKKADIMSLQKPTPVYVSCERQYTATEQFEYFAVARNLARTETRSAAAM